MPGPPDSDDSDKILYGPGRHPGTSRSAKSVSSNIPPYDRRETRKLLGVAEFRSVENLLNNKPRRRPEQSNRIPSADSSRANAITIDDDEDKDDIQDSGPEISRPSAPYEGTANRAPPRPMGGRIANRVARRQIGIRFGQSDDNNQVHYPNAAGASNGMNTLRKTPRERNDSRHVVKLSRREPDEVEDISDDELQYDEKPTSKGKQKGNIMSQFAKKPISDSLSRAGEIPPSYTRNSQRIAKGKTGVSKAVTPPPFLIEYIRSSSQKWMHNGEDAQWYIQYNPRDSTFDIMANGKDISTIYDSFVIKPGKIIKAMYSENGKTVLSASVDTTKPGPSKLLIRFDADQGGRFIQTLQKAGFEGRVCLVDE
jgi:hypothetical protein